MIEFTAWPKTARLSRETMVITEKIDGTNAAVGIKSALNGDIPEADISTIVYSGEQGIPYIVYAQSRTRIITPDKDNYGFAGWVYRNAGGLVDVLGEGLHFGEWWGAGIQRRYGLTEKRFSLFNTARHTPESLHLDVTKPSVDQLDVVPVLYVGPFDIAKAKLILKGLEGDSVAAPGFPNPEGICIYLPLVGKVYKMTFENDLSKFQLEGELRD